MGGIEAPDIPMDRDVAARQARVRAKWVALARPLAIRSRDRHGLTCTSHARATVVMGRGRQLLHAIAG